MATQHRRARPVVALLIAFGISIGWTAAPAPVEAALPTWTGSINLYRTAGLHDPEELAVVHRGRRPDHAQHGQGPDDHSTASQRRYFAWMRQQNRYDLPVSAGVDPAGWTAGLRHFVDDRYRLSSSATFLERAPARRERLRLTNLPVALTVSHGNHGWVLTGSPRPPIRPSHDFGVTSVRVTGPLWGLPEPPFGYDMRPNTKITPGQLQRFFTPWRYAPKR